MNRTRLKKLRHRLTKEQAAKRKEKHTFRMRPKVVEK